MLSEKDVELKVNKGGKKAQSQLPSRGQRKTNRGDLNSRSKSVKKGPRSNVGSRDARESRLGNKSQKIVISPTNEIFRVSFPLEEGQIVNSVISKVAKVNQKAARPNQR